MQQSWRQLAADMEQYKRHDSPQRGSSTEFTEAQAGLHLTHLFTLMNLLLQLWMSCSWGREGRTEVSQQPPSKLIATVSTMAYLEDVSTGIAAIWRREGPLQQWHAAAARSSAAHGFEAAPAAAAAAAAHMPQRSGRQQAEALRANQRAILTTVLAAIRLSCFLTWTMSRNRQKLPGSGAAHNLQWVMLVYTALLVSRLQQKQEGMSPVQLHTQPIDSSTTASSGNQQGPTSSRSAASGSMGSTKKGSNKKGSRTQQASSSSSSSAGASSPALKQQQGSRVHPYHLVAEHSRGCT